MHLMRRRRWTLLFDQWWTNWCWVNRHFSECAISGVLRFFKPKGNFIRSSSILILVKVRWIFPRLWLPSKFRSERNYFDPAILDFQLWQAEPELCMSSSQLKSYKNWLVMIWSSPCDWFDTGKWRNHARAAQLNITPRRLRTQLSEAVSSKYFLTIAVVWLKNFYQWERRAYCVFNGFLWTKYRAFKRWTNETPVEYRKRIVKY